jgi:hypothetical protein
MERPGIFGRRLDAGVPLVKALLHLPRTVDDSAPEHESDFRPAYAAKSSALTPLAIMMGARRSRRFSGASNAKVYGSVT